jgi:hypothetical protein
MASPLDDRLDFALRAVVCLEGEYWADPDIFPTAGGLELCSRGRMFGAALGSGYALLGAMIRRSAWYDITIYQ